MTILSNYNGDIDCWRKMQFNSVKRGNFSGLARSVSKSAAQAFDAARSTATDHTAIAKESIKGRSMERRAAMEAEGKVARAGLQAFAKVKDTKNDIDSAKKINDIKRPAKRMAGIVAGLGALTTGYVTMEENKKTKAENDQLRAERDALDAKQDIRDAEADKRTQQILDQLTKTTNSSGDTSSDLKPSTNTGSSTPLSSTSGTKLSPSKPTSGKSNWGALSSIIRTVEGTSGDKGYTTRFGGHQFDDLSKHPNTAAPTPWGTKSEAAGAYQFMKPTWDEAKAALNLPDFSRESQEKAGRFLTERRGVNPDAKFNTFEEFSSAISKLSPEWAGLPNSQSGRSGYHGQANSSMKDLWSQYQTYFN